MTLLEPILALPALSTVALGSAAGVVGYGLFAPRSQLFGEVVWRAPRASGPRVALTFDDGPMPGVTDPILDALAGAGARACFFVIGRHARAHPGLIRRIANEGHLIGNHTFDHDRTGLFRGTGYWLDQLARTDDAVAQVTGAAPRLFRPPMGFKSPPLVQAARSLGHAMVSWSRRGFDGVGTSGERIARLAGRARPGDIILLHDGRDPASRRDATLTARVLPAVLARLRERGLKPARLDELLQIA